MSFRKAMVAGALALTLSLAVLITTSIWHHRLAARSLSRIEMAQHQALLVTRLETDIVARQLADRSQHVAMDQAIAVGMRAYLDSIENERHLIDTDAESQTQQTHEWARAQELAGVIADPDRARWRVARALSHDIAVREQEEAREAAQSIAQAQRWSGWLIGSVALFILLLCGATGWLLWRGIVAPIATLIDGTDRLRAERAPARVRLQGLHELQHLAAQFNDMAEAIETQVATRTTALEQANQRLRDIDGRRRLFLSKVSHELRTPVTVMRGEAEVALRRPEDRAALEDALVHIVDSGQFLHRRLDDLLALAQAEDGALSVAPRPIDLALVLRDAHAMVAPFARSSGIGLQLEAASDAVPVVGDPDRLRQALVAIIDNGIKFSPPDGMIRLDMRSDGDRARIAISDDGPGVAEADLVRIFDPYFQADVGRSRGGTGLGLALARWIADRHGGQLDAANHRMREGLRVSLTLPVVS